MSDETLALAIAAFKAWQDAGSIVETGLAVFGVGFVIFGAASMMKRSGCCSTGSSLAERTGDLVTQTFYVTYLTVLYRKLGKLDEVKQFAARSLDLAGKTQMKQYLGMTTANLAWLAWREERTDDAKRFGQETLDHWSGMNVQYPFRGRYNCRCSPSPPADGRINDAADCARKMLSPDQQRLPGALA